MIQRTGKYYSGKIGGDEIQGELIWFGKTPTIRGWWREQIILTAEEVEQMNLDDEKSVGLCLKGRDHMSIR
ncbi:MAG: hypothetical protein IJG33_12710 [Selenomonadaceae bacterium]|nr:hypothetical protein [Selenomonadaceae bacterium]